MRLLRTRLANTGRFEIEEFADDKIPRYAIVSHVWGKGEVTLQDIGRGLAVSKEAYDKLKNCCSVAEAHGFEYVWVDTCCIDKTSSAELSEAINSMFRWYEDAAVCYAYLADVTSLSEFPNSKWFTRGWTLQELIAPSEMVFLNSDWEELGTKASLEQRVSRRTGIPPSILAKRDGLETASIAQRMSWAATRATTRVEDLAYSLLGIFGINMPLLYGEGQSAFVRLQEEIMRVSDDHSLFAWRYPTDHGGLLAPCPAAFANSRNIIPWNPFAPYNNPLTVTNKGLHLDLHFAGLGQRGLGLAALHCTEIGQNERLIALYLRDTFLTMEHFERHRSEEFRLLDPTKFSPSRWPVQSLCIRLRDLTQPSKDKQAIEPVQQPTSLKRHRLGQNRTGLRSNVQYESLELLLSHAAMEGQEAIVEQLLTLDVNAGWRDEKTRTPLSLAAERGHEAIIKLLLDRSDVDADFRDVNGLTPLLHAAAGGHEGVVWLLLTRSDVSIHSCDIDGRTVLSHAARGGHDVLVKQLLARRDLRTLADPVGRTALSHAAENGHEPLVRWLLGTGREQPDSKDDGKLTPLWYAAFNGHAGVVRLLLETGRVDLSANVTAYGTPLWQAATRNYPAVVKLLLDKAGDVDFKERGGELLWHAAGKGYGIVTQLLLEHGIDGEHKISGWDALDFAAKNTHKAALSKLFTLFDCREHSVAELGLLQGQLRQRLKPAELITMRLTKLFGQATVECLLSIAAEDFERQSVMDGHRECVTAVWYAALNENETIVNLLRRNKPQKAA